MHNAYSFENLEARVTALTSEQNPMTAILTQNEAREVWIAFNASPSATHHKISFRTGPVGPDGVTIYSLNGCIHVNLILNFEVIQAEKYPSILALATRYGLTR